MAKTPFGFGKRKRFASETIELPRLAVSSGRANPIAVLGPPEVERKVVLEPLSTRGLYDLSYACLLIPRFGRHMLRGDVVPFLRELMYQICVSFGWRLDYVMIRPEFMQYVISAPASTPPVRSVRVIREMTSKRIFSDYPHYGDENVGTDFWAAPYLVVFGTTPHSPETIIDFIRVTRQGQGFVPGRGR